MSEQHQTKTLKLSLLAVVAATILYSLVSYKIIDKEAFPYYSEYVSLIPEYCQQRQMPSKLRIAFMSNKDLVDYIRVPDAIGVCVEAPIGTHTIFLNKDWWDKADGHGREQLVMHELSHCILDKDHVDDYKNYMYPSYNAEITHEQLVKQVQSDIEETCSE